MLNCIGEHILFIVTCPDFRFHEASWFCCYIVSDSQNLYKILVAIVILFVPISQNQFLCAAALKQDLRFYLVIIHILILFNQFEQ